MALVIKNPPAIAGDVRGTVRALGWEDPLKWQPITVFLPGKFHGQRSLAGYSPWGRKELDMTLIGHDSNLHLYSF